MSLKVNEFAEIITQPLNTYNFVVQIPGVDLDLVVSSTTFPSEKLGEVVLHYQGEAVYYPTIPKNGGNWKVSVPESDKGVVKKSFDALKQSVWNQKTGSLNPTSMKRDIKVIARDMANNIIFEVVLHKAFILGREMSGTLDNSRNDGTWSWEYEFKYTWIEDIDVNVD